MKARGWSPGEIVTGASVTESRRIHRRLAAGLAAAFAVLLVLAFLINSLIERRRLGTEIRSSLGTRADAYRGSFEVLRRLGFRVERNRRAYSRLPPPADTVLVIVDPLSELVLTHMKGTRLDRGQVRELKRWMAEGGRVVAAPPGRVSWNLLGLELETESLPGLPAGPGDMAESVLDRLPAGIPPREGTRASGRLEGLGEIAGFSGALRALGPQKGRLCSAFLRRPGGGQLLPGPGNEGEEMMVFTGDAASGMETVATLDGRVVVAAAREGDGRMWLFSSAYPFTNLALAEADAGPLLAAIIDVASEGGRRTVVFDEYCHGLWIRRGLLAWVLGTTLIYPAAGALILALVLVWRGAVRAGAPLEERTVPRRAKEEYVLSLADILHRAGRFRSAARSLLEAFRGRHPAWAHRVNSMDDDLKRASFGEADLLGAARRIDQVKKEMNTTPGRRIP